MKNLSFVIFLWILTSSCLRKEQPDEKVLYLGLSDQVKGMDPIIANDRYTAILLGFVYESLYQYHPLKRPFEIMPNLAAELPQVSADGLTYTIKLRTDIYFHDDPCFPEGKGRLMTADDVIYSFKRQADPRNVARSLGWWMFDGKLAGVEEWRKKYQELSATNYSDEIEGIKKIDQFTLQFKTIKPWPQFIYALAQPFAAIVAKEAVEKYGAEFTNYPIGTGPFLMKRFKQSTTYVFHKNPNYRLVPYPDEGAEGDRDLGLLADAGKLVPLVDRVVVKIMNESQTKILNFKGGRVDYLYFPRDELSQVMTPSQSLQDSMLEKGVKIIREPSPDITYICLNYEDPLFRNNLKLRQAISMGMNRPKRREITFSNTGVYAQSIVPPMFAGVDTNYDNPYVKYNPEKAKKLLAEAGYPEGKGLPVLEYETLSSAANRRGDELFLKSMKDIGIKLKINKNTWPQLNQKVKTKQAQMFGMAWGADYPDAENFLQLLYGPNQAPGSNGCNYDDLQFNKLFKLAVQMPESEERTEIYKKLYRMAGDAMVYLYLFHREDFYFTHVWFKNFKYTPFEYQSHKWFNIDKELKLKTLKEKF